MQRSTVERWAKMFERTAYLPAPGSAVATRVESAPRRGSAIRTSGVEHVVICSRSILLWLNRHTLIRTKTGLVPPAMAANALGCRSDTEPFKFARGPLPKNVASAFSARRQAQRSTVVAVPYSLAGVFRVLNKDGARGPGGAGAECEPP